MGAGLRMAEGHGRIALLCHRKSLFTDGSGRLCRNGVFNCNEICLRIWRNSELDISLYIKIEETGQRGGDYGIHQPMHDRAQ